MNKIVLISNIMKIKTNIEQTIINLTSLIDKEKCYSKSQLQKNINILRVKIQSDDSYKMVDTEYFVAKLLLGNCKQMEINYRNLINSISLSIIPLNNKLNEITTTISEEQREMEILANSLNISENDEQLIKLIRHKRHQIEKMQQSLKEIEKEIKDKKDEIDFYNAKLERIKLKIDRHNKELEGLTEYSLDEESKSVDQSKLQTMEGLLEVIVTIERFKEIVKVLDEIIAYLNTREATMDFVNDKKVDLKKQLADINSVLTRFIKSIDINLYVSEKEKIEERINSIDNYNLSSSEKSDIEKEISRLKFAISLLQNDIVTDELVLSYYDHRIDFISDEYNRTDMNNGLLQNRINRLMLTKSYFINENSQSQNDSIDKEIKSQSKLTENGKFMEKLIGYKLNIKNAVSSIKKVRKDGDSFKTLLESKLSLKIENLSKNKTSRYSLDEDKKDLLMLELVIQMFEFINSIIDKKYLQRLDDIEQETYDPFIEILSFSEYENLGILYSREFIDMAKDSMERMIRFGNVEQKSALFMKSLNDQGIRVVRYGKSLQTMEKQMEQVKEKVI